MTDLHRIVEQLPGYREAMDSARGEGLRHRADRIQKVREHRDGIARAESQLNASGSDLTRKADALRAQLAAVEQDLASNTAAWNSARGSAEADIRQLQTELRGEVIQQVTEFQQHIVHTRDSLQHGFSAVRTTILGDRGETNEHVVAALATLLGAYNEVEIMATEAADVETAIANLRARLTQQGIRLIAPGLVH